MSTKITWFNLPAQVKNLIATKVASLKTITASDLPAVAAIYLNLTEARTSVAEQNVAVEARLDILEAKYNALLNALKTV